MKVLVSGGGTGGHIYPAVSLVKYIKKKHPDAEFLFVGTKKGLESKIVPDQGIPFETIEIQGFKRSLSLSNFKTVYLFLSSIKKAKQIIKKFQPDIVIGTGGYVCGSVVYAAHKLNIPTIIHEQNSVAGVTNKFLARYVDKIGICFSDVTKDFPTDKVVMVGNPRAQEVANIKQSDVLTQYGLQTNVSTVLIFGGSRGALAINKALLDSLSLLTEKPYQILYASGEIYFSDVEQKWKTITGNKDNIKVVPYIKNMENVLANVDVVVGRAGATSLAEITSLGLPSILIPSPNVTNDHQTKNAQSLVDKHAALMIRNDELTKETLVSKIDELMLNQNKRSEMAEASKKEGIQDATDRLYRLIIELIS
ncbi:MULTISPECIES: undecaprenyldiphospho-muramoylpentapeptide beta-N-acetylglucosaminyltransferase [Vagococcus]|uniref:UDP-N-acetylglucosamine--N-acetylmuramyl-(pentapeptide) pyrophosphoryl-undecaprenol N-acetylglucosamine transferase n=1 Tax=Vagococcus fluvialis bH819 TaxID=1255619 RepID=A0A1X6WM06_9ENTE|nr:MULTISPECIES: undecaprenyldiphospho-muramoylpentapeptide beta-N-acetylglucosaminyltransferase [Vagococcus]SLM85364.1 UDP-N-acetylglucosamine--N-acetylmuramyl-(pentapeptide) pyrophosphoryl-undecaprenol N-acetylglucosamine transferase [Vagococcus fluvialis bH819]HCM89341.1 undecaprenyldiphospho-muramoylpentapeptide beta-N-acetylglucosaminyltransferase [Vagococcus sp.]